jgi:hypothetical protein
VHHDKRRQPRNAKRAPRGQRPKHHEQVPAAHNERRRGQRPGATIKYLRRTTSDIAGIGLYRAAKYLRGAVVFGLGAALKYLSGAAGICLGTTIKKLRRSTSGAAGNGLYATIKHLRRATSAAAGSGLGTTVKYLVNQKAGAGNKWAKAHYTKAGHKFCSIPLMCSGFCTNWMAHKTHVRCGLFGSASSFASANALARSIEGACGPYLSALETPQSTLRTSFRRLSSQAGDAHRNTAQHMCSQTGHSETQQSICEANQEREGVRKSNNGAAIARVPTR